MEGFLDPNQVLEKLMLTDEMVAADFGCGAGNWVIPLVRKLKEGKVFAIDILEEPLSALEGKLRQERLDNVRLIRANVEDKAGIKQIASDSLDLGLMTNLLFEVSAKKTVLAEAKRMLKPDGIIVVIDWKKDSPFGPAKKVLPEEIKETAASLGFGVEQEFDAGAYHWALILIKK